MTKLNVGRVVWVGLTVKDLEAEKRFYREMLDLEVLDSGEEWAHLDLGGGHLLELLRLSGEAPSDKKGFRPGFQVGNIVAARDELVARGAKPVGDIEGGAESGGLWCSFRDPEGNYFEIKQIIRPAAGLRAARKGAGKKGVGKKGAGKKGASKKGAGGEAAGKSRPRKGR